MSKVFMQIEVSMVLPTIHVYRDYFNSKYPCTDDSNDGSDMPLEDEIKYEIYNFLLASYNKCPDLYNEEYTKVKNLVSTTLTPNS